MVDIQKIAERCGYALAVLRYVGIEMKAYELVRKWEICFSEDYAKRKPMLIGFPVLLVVTSDRMEILRLKEFFQRDYGVYSKVILSDDHKYGYTQMIIEMYKNLHPEEFKLEGNLMKNYLQHHLILLWRIFYHFKWKIQNSFTYRRNKTL